MSPVGSTACQTSATNKDPFPWKTFGVSRQKQSGSRRSLDSGLGHRSGAQSVPLYDSPPVLPALSFGTPIELKLSQHRISRSDSSALFPHRSKYAALVPSNHAPSGPGVSDLKNGGENKLRSIDSTLYRTAITAAPSSVTVSSNSFLEETNSKRREVFPEFGLSNPKHVAIVKPSWAETAEHQSSTPLGGIFEDYNSVSGAYLPLKVSRLSPINMVPPTLNGGRADAYPAQASEALPLHVDQPPSTNHSAQSIDPNVRHDATTSTARSSGSGTGVPASTSQTAGLSSSSPSNNGRSGLVCNVFRTTGREPRPLVGATTTIVGDKLYVFGGRKLSRTRPLLTSSLYELDLVHRHWTRLDAKGDVPPPRYFHSVCPLGDTKLVCYGGMSPAVIASGKPPAAEQGEDGEEPQPDVVVMSDIHIYDIPTNTWMKIPATDAPQGRYAHCAAILPSSAVFASSTAPHSAIHHNLPSANPTQGTIGVSLDGEGGAEMIVVGGQDSNNHYIEQISVFNLRSLKWTSTSALGRSCGAYRSIVAPLSPKDAEAMRKKARVDSEENLEEQTFSKPSEWSMLVYSNYNFLDVKLELQVWNREGVLSETPMQSQFTPPGLRFPNGGIINGHFVVCGTFLTSSKQEYALWALDLATLSWSRIDTGPSSFSQGSWNRGVLWHRRNNFVVLGNKKRSLVEDYNHRRINFANVAIIELESFGLYENPRKVSPSSSYQSASSPLRNLPIPISINTKHPSTAPSGRQLFSSAEELGAAALALGGLADMEFLALGGERVPVNSHTVARRWGPYFNQILREGIASASGAESETATLRPNVTTYPSRNSSITITPSIRTINSGQGTLADRAASLRLGASNMSIASGATATTAIDTSLLEPPDAKTPANPSNRPRTLFLPHTHLTIQALVHYLYTSSIPRPGTQLCTPQILCSLLQLARPYRVDGLLEAIVERLHSALDGRNTAAIFNATAMAAGSGDGVNYLSAGAKLSSALGMGLEGDLLRSRQSSVGTAALAGLGEGVPQSNVLANVTNSVSAPYRALRHEIDIQTRSDGRASDASSASEDDASSAASGDLSDTSDASGISTIERPGQTIWNGEVSAIIGLQKRGLRGLIEGRRLREMSVRENSSKELGTSSVNSAGRDNAKSGLGIA